MHFLGLDVPARLRRVQQIQAAAELRAATIISNGLGEWAGNVARFGWPSWR